MEAAISIPTLAPVLRALGGECVVVADVERVGELAEVVGVDLGVDADVGVVTDAEGVEDSVMLLLIDEVAEDNVIRLNSASVVKDSGEGA